MIQRRQSLYLLIIAILGIVLYFTPIVQFTSQEQDSIQRMYEFGAQGLDEMTDTYSYMADQLPPMTIDGILPLQITTILIPVLALIILFLFKARILQARLCILLALLNIGFYAIIGVYIYFGKRTLSADWDLLFGSCIPLINFVLTLMAVRLILKDEAKVRAADRLR